MHTGNRDHLALQMDVTQQSAVECVIAAVLEKFGGPPRLLVNCAGFFEMMPFMDMKESSFNTAIDINLKVILIIGHIQEII